MKNLHFFPLLSLLIISGCSTTNPSLQSLQGTAWVQRAAEYDMIALQTYQNAQNKLETALNDSAWTAELTQTGYAFWDLPPAVVLDIDETVLDNSPYQARLIQNKETYTDESWNAWVEEAQAEAVPGALSFTNRAQSLGVTVIYLSNRDASTESATRNNLIKLGFPVSDDMDVILLKEELPDWTSAKTARRAFVAENYRILMLFGDDMNDFFPAKDISHDSREQMLAKHREKIGSTWYVLPNPVYGSWARTLESENMMEVLITAEEDN